MKFPFERLLVANRGEAACRVIQAAKKNGIATVGIYSDDDCASLHAKMADMPVRLTGKTLEETYMDVDNVIQIALRNGVQAIHTSYGLLSEDKAFEQKCAENNIKFIGPKTKFFNELKG